MTVNRSDSEQNPIHHDPDNVPPPTGTLFVMTIYLAILIGMWSVMYFELLRR